MVWKPLQPDHAIERVRIIVSFGSDLPAKFLRKLAADNEEHRVALGFTSKNLRQGQQITLGASGMNLDSQPSELFGWDWQKLSPANSPLEVIVAENQALVYETLEYSRWKDFSKRFEVTALPILDSIVNVVDLKAVSLEYFDRFLFEGEPQKAAPGEVLRNINEHLPPEASSGSELWHFHRGWFEYMENEKILVNQNIDAQNGNSIDGGAMRSLQIFTKTELRINEASFDYNVLSTHLNSMHNRSKELFKSILTDDIQSKVGL